MRGIYARPNLPAGVWEVVAIDGVSEVLLFETRTLEDAVRRLNFEHPHQKFGVKLGELTP